MIPINLRVLRRATIVLGALDSESRITIVKCLLDKEEMSVQELQNELGWSQSLVSNHLRRLEKARMVTRTKDGKFMRYSLALDRLERAIKLVNALAALSPGNLFNNN